MTLRADDICEHCGKLVAIHYGYNVEAYTGEVSCFYDAVARTYAQRICAAALASYDPNGPRLAVVRKVT